MTFDLRDMTKWDKRFFAVCDLVASWSEDQSRKVGAVIVGPGQEIRSTGYNGFPRGVKAEDPARHSKEGGEKYHWFEHAERNAIYNAARHGTGLQGCTLYANLFPCADCVRAIIQSGITHLKTYEMPPSDQTYARSFIVSMEMLREAGIAVSTYRRPAA
jgi:dCMP deaminase